MPQDDFELEIRKILELKPGTGAFKETHTLDNGNVINHELSWATGMASMFRESEYKKRFGPLPGWITVLHPFTRSLLCRLAQDFERILPPQRTAALAKQLRPPLQPGRGIVAPETANKKPRRSYSPKSEKIRQALLAASTSERDLAPFKLSGRGHEKRVTLDRQLAQIVRDLDLPRYRASGYGPSLYYPERVFVRAAAELRQMTGEDVLVRTQSRSAYHIREGLPPRAGD